LQATFAQESGSLGIPYEKAPPHIQARLDAIKREFAPLVSRRRVLAESDPMCAQVGYGGSGTTSTVIQTNSDGSYVELVVTEYSFGTYYVYRLVTTDGTYWIQQDGFCTPTTAPSSGSGGDTGTVGNGSGTGTGGTSGSGTSPSPGPTVAPSANPSTIPSAAPTTTPTPGPLPTPNTACSPKLEILNAYSDPYLELKEVEVTACGAWTLMDALGTIVSGKGNASFLLYQNSDWRQFANGPQDIVLTEDGLAAQVSVTTQFSVSSVSTPPGQFVSSVAQIASGLRRGPSVIGPGTPAGMDPWEAYYLRMARYSNGGARRIPEPTPPFRVIVTPNGYSVKVPIRWVRSVTDNGKGLKFQRPEDIVAPGLKGLPKERNSIRIMDPTARHPKGYVRIYNKEGKPVDITGKDNPNPDATHIDLDVVGQIKNWPEQF
jgi:hypothetical protein